MLKKKLVFPLRWDIGRANMKRHEILCRIIRKEKISRQLVQAALWGGKQTKKKKRKSVYGGEG